MSSYFKAAKQAAADASKRAADMSKKAADYSSKKAAAAAAMTQEMTLLKKKRPTGDEERWDGGAPPDSPAGPTIGLNDLLNGGTPVGGPAREDGAQVVQMHAVDSPPSMATPSVDDDSRAKENGDGDARRPRDAARYPDGPMALRARQENETTGMTQPSSAENHGTSERERALEELLSRLTAEREKSVADSAAAEARAARAEARAADLEAELESLSEASETRRARFEHVQALHAERENALRRELEEAQRRGARDLRSPSASDETAENARSRRIDALEAENKRLRSALETAEAEAEAPSSDDAVDGERRAVDALRRRVAVAEAAAAMAREEASESRRAMAAELAEERREFSARADKAEASSTSARRGYEAAMEENARLRRAAGSSVSGGDRSGALAAAEAKAARLQATVASLEAENKSLQWQVAANVNVGDARKSSSSFLPSRAAETGAETGSVATLSPPLFERVLRDKTHRRAVVIGYLAVLHLLVYFSTVHGTFSHGARVRCVSGIADPGTT